ncbi:MAG: UDP-N-acetylmuramoyl-tripeptide--D-alanyl-D-alanine ligase [Kangiellaceae bacterium]|nr:UDP-N-acetylmuramoyl-tripeptide--D-alanyl-D-alanine ligase [Kangiellaceae bacterium]
MIPLTLETIATITGGQLVGDNLTIQGLVTDSRAQNMQGLFVALVGEKFDAHQFIHQAQDNGAIALLVSKAVTSSLPQIVVENSEQALGKIAAYVRQQVNPKVIGITGSAGKTSVKEMVASILRVYSHDDGKVLATKGNFNNHIGVPLTLLELTQQHEFAVIEMGANHKGEIAYTAHLAKPDTSAINNVEAAHIEGFGSIEGVAEAKSEIYEALSSSGTAVINLDCEFARDWQKQFEYLHKVTVSRHKNAQFTAHNCHLNQQSQVEFMLQHENDGCSQSVAICLPTPGMHNVSNALVAAALAHSVGVDMESIQMGLQSVASVKGRLNVHQTTNGITLIDDTYNASVGSVKAAIDYLASLAGHKLLVLGDMAELGVDSDKYHFEVGAYAQEKNIDQLFVWGTFVQHTVKAFGENARLFEQKEQLVEAIKSDISLQNVLVKGSRSARMEQVVEALLENDKENREGVGSC